MSLQPYRDHSDHYLLSSTIVVSIDTGSIIAPTTASILIPVPIDVSGILLNSQASFLSLPSFLSLYSLLTAVGSSDPKAPSSFMVYT